MLKPYPWANALGLTTVLAYLALWLLNQVAPTLFALVFNAQFLGANVVSLYPSNQDLGTLVLNLVLVGASSWLIGYIWARLYNRFAKTK